METRARYILVGLFVFVASLAGFGFVYWLHATGGLGERAIYRVRFENTVSGLRTGAAVSFNGIRVGEVTDLRLNPENPRYVFVTIAVDPRTPIRADSNARIDVQGLMGSPSIALSGGSSNLPVPAASQGEPPLLVAGASAGQDLTQSASEVLGRIDKLLADNSDSLHETIANFDTFSAARARNSKSIDGILGGLEKTFGSGASKALPTFDLTTPRVSLPRSRGRGSNDLGEERHAKNHSRRKRRTKLFPGQRTMVRQHAKASSSQDHPELGKCEFLGRSRTSLGWIGQ